MIFAKIGAISEATLNPRDLIPAMVEELEALVKKNKKHQVYCPAHEKLIAEVDGRMTEGDAYFESEEVSFDMEELETALQEFAPPFAYFGAHEGDGACIGFWPQVEILDDPGWDEDNDITRGGDGPSDEIKTGFYLQINDHGNATLYMNEGGTWRELWSVV